MALRADLAERSDQRRLRIPAPALRRVDVRAVVCFVSGPGRFRRLVDSIESVLASDGDSVQIMVIDDCSIDAREAEIRALFPDVVVVRRRVPTGGPPMTWPQLRLGVCEALTHHRFDLWVKLDSDSLVVGPRFTEVLAERMAAVPHAGLGGSVGRRADGAAEDRAYHFTVLMREAGTDPILETALERARRHGWAGEVVQGGGLCLTAEAARRLAANRWLDWRPRWYSQVSDDLALSIFVAAAGLQLASLGDPTGVVAVANNFLPLAKETLADKPWVLAHSLTTGRDGESEDELREFFAAARSGWPDRSRAPSAPGQAI